MALEKTPFQRDKLDEEKALEKGRVIPVRMNEDELSRLEASKKVLQQPKDSTTLKMLAEIGYIVLHDQLTGKIIQEVFKNKTKNARTGIVDL